VPARKTVVATYFEGFRQSDHHKILQCLTEDVVWDLPGFKHLEGKDAFDGEIENENFVGSPTLDVDRMIEEGDVVVAIGVGSSTQAGGVTFRFAFCDVFTFAGDRIRRVESYVVPVAAPDQD
jgi:ketosteroid isomerase-like protein